MKTFLVLFGVAFGIPALINAALIDTDTTVMPEQATWVLMPVGGGGFAVVPRAGRGPVAIERAL